jgi:hypothetical protein
MREMPLRITLYKRYCLKKTSFKHCRKEVKRKIQTNKKKSETQR